MTEEVHPNTWGEVVEWWSSRVGKLFALMADITHITDWDKTYLPYFHMAWLMNLDETFRRVSEISQSWQSSYAIRTLAFAALDLLAEVWHGGEMAQLCEPIHVAKAFECVEGNIPDRFHPILLPAARAAVRSIDELNDSFYIAENRGSATIDVVQTDGEVGKKERSSAIHSLVRARRTWFHGQDGKPQR
jgi:hypothetical protein